MEERRFLQEIRKVKMNQDIKKMMQNDPDPYIRAMHKDIPGGKWTALVICMLLFGWIPFVAIYCV
jgi:hypothetical protein